jgi:hypothetical protein
VQQALLHEEKKQHGSSSGAVPSNQSDSALLGAQDTARRIDGQMLWVWWSGAYTVDRGTLRTSDHVNQQHLEVISQNELVPSIKVPKNRSVRSVCKENASYMPLKSIGEICSTRKLQLVHSDICGPMETGGCKYYVTFNSHCCSVYFINQKSEVLEKFGEFKTATASGSDRDSEIGSEYLSEEFKQYLKTTTSLQYSTALSGVERRSQEDEQNTRGICLYNDCSCWSTQLLLCLLQHISVQSEL